MSKLPALFVTLQAAKNDTALHAGSRGARKILVTELYPAKEIEATLGVWNSVDSSGKCPVQVMKDAEVAVFTHNASQDRHYHKKGIEIYMVMEGSMIIEVEGEQYRLSAGDMIVVNPEAVHEVKRPEGAEFICRVITINCAGTSDKYVV